MCVSGSTLSWLAAPVGAQVAEYPSWEGPYTPIPVHHNPGLDQHCCEIAHAILIGNGPLQGRVLLIQSNGDRWIWNPAAPNSVGTEQYCDMIAPSDDMFCAGHSADGNGDLVVVGGARHKNQPPLPPCNPQPKYSYVYETGGMCWSPNYPLPTPNPPPPNPLFPSQPHPDFVNLGYYYPSTVRLPDGRVLFAGGGSDPVQSTCNDPPNTSNFYVDGWMVLDRAQGGWIGPAPTQWFPGIPGSYQPSSGAPVEHEFNYYPLLSLLPSMTPGAPGYVFAAVATYNRSGNYSTSGYVRRRSPTSHLPLAGAMTIWAWQAPTAQVFVPGTTEPRNLYYPNGFLWPMQLDAQGKPVQAPRFVVLGGTDLNDYLSGAQNQQAPDAHPFGGRPALGEVQSIADPESPSSAWTTGVLPPLTIPRIYGNTVLLPDGTLFVVGGSHYDFLPFAKQTALNIWQRERRADPVFYPELIDLTTSPASWQVVDPHVSPRLYHSLALLLPDGRVLVAGGYRGKVPPNPPPASLPPEMWTWKNWENEHSDLEIYSPPYLFAGARPQILGVTGGTTIGYGPTNAFEVTIAFPGQSNPAASIGTVTLISPGSVTHHYDWDNRFVKLAFSVTTSNKLSVVPPANGSVAPPGIYMLFVTSTAAAGGGTRIPSVAAFVHLQ